MERQLRRGEGEHASRRSTMGNLREDIIQVVDPDVFKRGLLPTPTAERPDGRKSEAFSKGRANFFDIVENDKWGAYSSAIRRWEKINGEAPDPTELTPKGKHRLNAGFAEWMMGLPPGWVTGETDEMWEARIEARKSGVETNPVGMRGSLKKWVLGISRNDQLRAIGNGVVPQQAIAALTDMIQATGNGGFFDIKKGKS